MKGRIMGGEGRKMRGIERVRGVDVMIEDRGEGMSV